MRWFWWLMAVSVLSMFSAACLQDFDRFRPTDDGPGGGGSTSSSTGGMGGGTSSSTGGGGTGGTGGGPICGDDTKNGTETCDGSDLGGQDCESIPGGYVGGTLACVAGCSAFDTLGCTVPPSCGDTVCNNGETCGSCPDDCGVCCGNDVIDNGEQCDGTDLNSEDCTSIAGGFISGTLDCQADCTFDTSMCNLPSCGDTLCNNGETCASCPGDCGACCGNGMINSGETCDGANLSGETCTSIPGGFIGGTLTCLANCTDFNTSACTPGTVCGNNNQEGAEVCDGSDLNSQTCLTVPGGFTSGILGCLGNCTAYDTSGCYQPPPTCQAGVAGTVDNIYGSGATQTSYFIDFASGVDFFSTTSPTTHNFNGGVLPGQFVLLGKDGMDFDLFNGANPVAKTWYKVTAGFPSPECNGSNLASQACAAAVAKSFRCQFPPYNEVSGCPSPNVTFVAQAPASSFTASNVGFEMWLVDLTCP